MVGLLQRFRGNMVQVGSLPAGLLQCGLFGGFMVEQRIVDVEINKCVSGSVFHGLFSELRCEDTQNSAGFKTVSRILQIDFRCELHFA